MMKKLTVKTASKSVKTTKNTKEFYSFKNYTPNKNAKPVTYNGTQYLSKAQCMALEGITRKELDAYLAGNVEETLAVETETFEESVVADPEAMPEIELDPEDLEELEDEKEDEEDLPF